MTIVKYVIFCRLTIAKSTGQSFISKGSNVATSTKQTFVPDASIGSFEPILNKLWQSSESLVSR